jgi:hypothetical protein
MDYIFKCEWPLEHERDLPWLTCRSLQVHWIGTTSADCRFVIIADHCTAVPITFSGIFGVGYGYPFWPLQLSLTDIH